MIRLDYFALSHASTNGLERLVLSLGLTLPPSPIGVPCRQRTVTVAAYRASLIQRIQRAEAQLARGRKLA